MKKLSTAIFIAALTLIGCEQFSTSYERIDATEFRMLDFIYSPADFAPGDTFTLMAVFAGKDVRNDAGNLDDYIDWYVSFNIARDLFGTETVMDSTTPLLQHATRFDTTLSSTSNTYTAAFHVVVPHDVIRNSASIPEQWSDMLRQYMGTNIPSEFDIPSKQDAIGIIEAMAARGDTIDPRILQLFTAPMRITAKMHEPGRLPHRIVSSHSVRYNSRFRPKGLWEPPINRNPAVDSIVVYKVKGSTMFFDSKTGTAESSVRIDNAKDPVIAVEGGYSYFIEAASGSTLDYTTTMFGNRVEEKHYANWQFALDTLETAGVHHSKFMDFRSVMGGSWSISPPTNSAIKKFTFWVTVTDEVINERMRPGGSTLVEVQGRFEYR